MVWLGEVAQVHITIWVERAKIQPEPKSSMENNKMFQRSWQVTAQTGSLRLQQQLHNIVACIFVIIP